MTSNFNYFLTSLLCFAFWPQRRIDNFGDGSCGLKNVTFAARVPFFFPHWQSALKCDVGCCSFRGFLTNSLTEKTLNTSNCISNLARLPFDIKVTLESVQGDPPLRSSDKRWRRYLTVTFDPTSQFAFLRLMWKFTLRASTFRSQPEPEPGAKM